MGQSNRKRALGLIVGEKLVGRKFDSGRYRVFYPQSVIIDLCRQCRVDGVNRVGRRQCCECGEYPKNNDKDEPAALSLRPQRSLSRALRRRHGSLPYRRVAVSQLRPHSVDALLGGPLSDAFHRKIRTHKRRGRDRENLIGRGVAHLNACRGWEKDLIAPTIAPKPIGSGKSEGYAKRSSYKHDRVFEIQLGVDCLTGLKRLERRLRTHQCETSIVDCFGQSHKFEMWGGSGGVVDANQLHRFRFAEKKWSFRHAVGRDEFSRLEVRDQPLKTKVE